MYGEENFIESSKILKSTIQKCCNKNQNQLEIKYLAKFYNENLKAIFENFKYSKEQQKIYCLQTDNEYTKECRNIKKKIKSYSELDKLYQDRHKIINESVEQCKSKIDVKFNDNEVFITKIEKLKSNANNFQIK